MFAAWVGIYLRTAGHDGSDWDEIANLLEDALRTIAPRALIAQLDRL